MQTRLRHRIADRILRDYVTSGKLAPGEALPTVRELQLEFGTSIGTIMNAMAILETQGVIESRHGSGCYLTGVLKSDGDDHANKRKNKRGIGLICNTMLDYFHAKLHFGVDVVCTRNGRGLYVAATNHSYEQERIQIERLIDLGCEGIVLYPAIRTTEEAASDYLNSEFLDFPIVLVDLALPSHRRPQVLFDNYRLGIDVTNHLLDLGHRKIAFMNYHGRDKEYVHRSVMDRHRGYLEAMRRFGAEPTEWMLDGTMAENPAHSITSLLREWIGMPDRPTALIALEDSRAALTISIAHELGIRIPEELEVVGFDNLPISQVIRPHFTTTNADFVRAGEIAAEMLFDLIEGKADGSDIYMLSVPLLNREARPVTCKQRNATACSQV